MELTFDQIKTAFDLATKFRESIVSNISYASQISGEDTYLYEEQLEKVDNVCNDLMDIIINKFKGSTMKENEGMMDESYLMGMTAKHANGCGRIVGLARNEYGQYYFTIADLVTGKIFGANVFECSLIPNNE